MKRKEGKEGGERRKTKRERRNEREVFSPFTRTPTPANDLYQGGTWNGLPMTRVPLTGPLAPQTDPLPMYIADMYQGSVTGIRNSLVDYFVVATDGKGNTKRTDIQHVWVGSSN
jgi:hypothetical protein